MPGLVVGIFPGSDPAAIEAALGAQQIDLTKVKVVTRASATQKSDASPIEFVTVAASFETDSVPEEMTRGTGIMGDSGGTSVPGIGGSGPSLGSFNSRGGASALNYLSGLAIPGDEVDNFNAAVSEGRAVVAYPGADSDAAAIAAAFRAAGLRNVRTY